MGKCKSVKISNEAYEAVLNIKNQNIDRYKERGLVGVFDDLLLHRFSTTGRGSHNRKKS